MSDVVLLVGARATVSSPTRVAAALSWGWGGVSLLNVVVGHVCVCLYCCT